MQDIGRRMDCLFGPLDELESFRELTRALDEPGVCSAYGPDDAQRAHLLSAVALRTGRPVLVIEPNDMAASRMAEDMCSYDTYMMSDYSRYDILDGVEERRAKHRDEQFPKDLEAAYDLGKRLVGMV